MENIIAYIKRVYHPLSIIVYGSYADGTNNLNSDFDALVVSSDHEAYHDTSFADGIQLDVFVYPAAHFRGDYDCRDFIQIFDGRIITDTNGLGKEIQGRVRAYAESQPVQTEEEIRSNIAWCVKMAERVKRNDAEGMFRWHWLLVESLEIFCGVWHVPYWGPKKTLRWMEMQHPQAFACYAKALTDFTADSLHVWINYLKSLEQKAPHDA